MSLKYEWFELVTLKYGIGFLPLPLDREDHVVGVEVARRLPRAVVVPLDALAQVERVDLAVGRDRPSFSARPGTTLVPPRSKSTMRL